MADDVLLISEDDVELQLMFNLSYIKSQEKRFHIHPQKTVIVRKNVSKAKQKQEVISDWKLGSTSVNVNSQSVHLGLIRAEKAENNINISDRISLARRKLYSLIKAGVHRNNGLNPKVSYRIYLAYVIPWGARIAQSVACLASDLYHAGSNPTSGASKKNIDY